MRLVGGFGLGTAGQENVRKALEFGQVDELPVTATPEPTQEFNELIRLACNTAASIRFIEDAALLERVGGVGALLRFRL